MFGISTDDVKAQAAFAKAQNLDYPLLADPDTKAAKAYGVLMAGRPYAKRVTFVVDDKGVLRHVFQRVSVRSHGQDVADVTWDSVNEAIADGDLSLREELLNGLR